jgi:hypothetical protein
MKKGMIAAKFLNVYRSSFVIYAEHAVPCTEAKIVGNNTMLS